MVKLLSVIEETQFLTEWIDSKNEFSPIDLFRETEKKAVRPKRVSRR